MADTGGKREIRQRANAHEAEKVAESRKLIQKARASSTRRKPAKPGKAQPPKSRPDFTAPKTRSDSL